MKRKAVLGIMLTLLFIGILSLTFEIQQVEAPYPIIYIKADGSIDPSTAKITSPDNVTYTFTADINASIVVEKNNTVVDGAGYTLQGTGSGTGIDLTGRSNVTLKNMKINAFWCGIYLISSFNNTISGNNITNNQDMGIRSYDSFNNTISGNNMAENNAYGIWLMYGSSNKITENTFANCGLFILYSYENLVVDNLVNGKPLVYLEGISNYTVEDAGQVILVNCNRIRVENLAISNTTVAVTLSETNNTKISGNNITANRYYGIYLVDSSNNTISGNNITNNLNGVRVWKSSNNIMTKNNVTNNLGSIGITQSSNNSITENYIANNEQAFGLGNSSHNTITKNIITANYDAGIRLSGSSNNWIAENEVIQNYEGIILMYSSNNNSITSNNLTNNSDGVWIMNSSNNNWIDSNTITANTRYGMYLLYSSNYNRITGNNLTANDLHGLWLWNSSNNYITENKIANNGVARDGFGIRLWEASNNTIYHNNFIDNNHQVFTHESENIWDDGYPSGGNYWSDYNGTDANQDGIGDTAYDIYVNNQDNYPLMGMFYDFRFWDVNIVISNSTIHQFSAGYHMNSTTGTWEKCIMFHVLGTEGTVGFCRVMIPRDFMESPYTVLVNNEKVNATELSASNSSHAFLYFTYTHSGIVMIIPEFPSFLILPLFMMTTLVAIIVYRRKYSN
ncbi:MAG: right-handed parallel beta-helix repeat-containing protein [Candidatus Bathyarchaeota archaeon]|nr:right-handed parallel beta-helix repeat-containing protein [Candidatus Bathyarchaeota archaeon]